MSSPEPGPPPSWPRLAGWLATASARTATGRWRTSGTYASQEGGFAYRAPDDWHRTWDGLTAGPGGAAAPLWWLLRPVEHGRARRALAEPVAAARHDGRLCWRAHLHAPSQGGEPLVLLVDDATGLCLSASDPDGAWSEEVLELATDVVLPDGLFDVAVSEREQRSVEQRLFDLLHEHSVPVPRWFPWRRGDLEPAGWRSVAAAQSDGHVARIRPGQPVPRLPWAPDDDPQTVQRDGWTYVVAGGDLDPAAVRAVVDAVVEGRPYDW